MKLNYQHRYNNFIKIITSVHVNRTKKAGILSRVLQSLDCTGKDNV
jgi:hypothetical protein